MQNLYNENSYKKDFTAKIINVFELDNKYHIELDKTYFNPKTLDQPYDSDKINNANVTNAYKNYVKITM